MADLSRQKANLKAILEIGLTIQTFGAILAFAVKRGKRDFLIELNKLTISLTKSLSEEEKTELRKDIETMLQQKAKEFLTVTGQEIGPDKLDEVVDILKEATQVA